jgi:hypothetical protein
MLSLIASAFIALSGLGPCSHAEPSVPEFRSSHDCTEKTCDCAQKTIPQGLRPGDRERVESYLPKWKTLKLRSRKAMTSANSRLKESLPQVPPNLEGTWKLAGDIEATETRRRAKLLNKLAGLGLDAKEFRKRTKAVDRLFQIWMLYLYGAIVPFAINEQVINKDGVCNGRDAAGKDWFAVIDVRGFWELDDKSGFSQLGHEYRIKTGFSREEAAKAGEDEAK